MTLFNNLYKNYIQPIRSFNRSARLFLWMTVIDGIIMSVWQLFFNFYMLQSGFSRDFLGLANSLPSVAALVFGIAVGRFSDRIGRKPSMILGVSLTSLALLGQVTFKQPVIILVMAFLGGIFNMLFIISQAPLIMKLSDPENRTLLFSLNFGVATLAGALGSLFAGQLPVLFGRILNIQATSASAYQAVLITSITLGTTSLIPLWLMDEPRTLQTGPEAGSHATGPRSALRLLTIKLALPNLLTGFGAAILIPYMNVFFKDRFNISDSLLGILFGLSSLLIGIGTFIGPRLTMRLSGKIRTVVFTQFSSLVFLMIAGFTPSLWLASIGFLMRAALMNMSAPLYSAFCMEQTPERDQGMVNSVLNISWSLGWAVGPYISGLVQVAYGFTPLFITTGVLYLTAIIMTWVLFHKMDDRLTVDG
ncbi:MAG: MFS transporter [Anaerolineales bacterium]|nr:MFS transporter [Anaerolineales bacterium]